LNIFCCVCSLLFGTYLANEVVVISNDKIYFLPAERLMDIKAQSLYQEMQGMAQQSKLGLSEGNAIQGNPSSQNFADLLSNAIGTVNDMQLESKDMAMSFEMGDKSLSLADVMVAKEKAGIAFEATIQVRNKVLDAYKQIMNMPV
jgi:flagellar hook-basal body complex protein FliE